MPSSAASPSPTPPGDAVPARRAWMATLAKAPPARLSELAQGYLAGLPQAAAPRFTMLRKPEAGLVMLRARAGGSGAPFNMGEMTVTRCTVRLETGVGADGAPIHGAAYIAGRDGAHAALAAKLDALLQAPGHADALRRAVIEPLERERKAARAERARQVGATKVEFFTMVRGED
ncbi:MAG: phosphonate C-P lyase system protein PhnG [Alphaproteobacteria bacterium]|nr:phosphonate C-P lyase system protein PhnG [Alphaproteobacteria bacterium]